MSEIGVIIPTYNGADSLADCLDPLIRGGEAARILVVDSSSTDGTVDIARAYGVEVISIEKRAFQHGRTREAMRRELGTAICVMFTQDVIPLSSTLLSSLTAPIRGGEAAVSYARQLPKASASPLEWAMRHLTYPAQSHLRRLSNGDIHHYGSYLFFCSNACAAYDNRALDEVGGFPSVEINEEAIAVAKLLRSGKQIAYVAEAEVIHSHDHSLWEMFRRQVSIGAVRRRYKSILSCGESDEALGMRLIFQLTRELRSQAPTELPRAFGQLLVKWVGYRMGRLKARVW